MKHHFSTKQIFSVIVLFFITSSIHSSWSGAIVGIKGSGQCATDGAVAINMNTLNDKEGNDFVWYTRSTIDYSLNVSCGFKDCKFVEFFDTVRCRYIWGAVTDTNFSGHKICLPNSLDNITATSVNKHLIWLKEVWLKFGLATTVDKHYIQLGLIPFEVGRGISLGAAYDISGFLGFSSDFAVDQYAPAALIHFDFIPQRYTANFYTAVLSNKQSSFADNLEYACKCSDGSALKKTIGGQSYLLACNHKVTHEAIKDVEFEAYLVHLATKDQKIEFEHDSDIFLTTVGGALEGSHGRFSWGCEGACNFGCIDLKAWDRNKIVYQRNSDGKLIGHYTKVYDQEPSSVGAQQAIATDAHQNYVCNNSSISCMNGQQIGPDLYNAYDRFRSAQRKKCNGFLLIADATYQIVPDVFSLSVGAGYASGDAGKRLDANKMTYHSCMNQELSAFIPLQSEYVGKRIRHIVFFNQGLPRCNDLEPEVPVFANLTNQLETTTFVNMSNISFIGMRGVWHVPALKENALELSGNVVGYFLPEPHVDTLQQQCGQQHDFVGLEISSEFSWKMWKKLRVEGYGGVFIPGPFYHDNCGKQLQHLHCPVGCDVGYIVNCMIAYEF